MTDKAVSALTSLTGANTATGDLIYIVDISEASAADRSKKITAQELQNYIKAFPATIGVGGATPAASGAGISFPATASASSDANTLDDYEEGTWTATLKGSVSDPTTPVTSTCRYTKIGNVVTLYVGFESVNTTGASGFITITGVPFTNNASIRAMGVAASYGTATFSADTYLIATISLSSTTIDIQEIKSADVWTAATHSAGSGRYIWAQINYTI
jgi:hypothetical protein